MGLNGGRNVISWRPTGGGCSFCCPDQHTQQPQRAEGVSSGHRSRLNDEDSVRAPHQGQQSTRTAPTGRTHDCKRPLCCTPNDLLPGRGHPHMKRRDFITLLGGAAAAWPLAAGAQQAERVRRVGVLMSSTADDEGQARLAAFVQGLQTLGWTEGRNLRIDVRWTGSDSVLIRKYAAELVALAPDVILASGGTVVGGLLQATRTLPVVFTSTLDPVGAGYVASLSRPGGNATGFTAYEYGLSAKWLEVLKEVAPRVTKAAVLRDATVPQ